MAFDQQDFEKLFGGLVEEFTDLERSMVYVTLNREEVKAGDVLAREGEERPRLLFVGTARLGVSLIIDGRPVEVGEFGAGSILGEVSFLLGGPASATVTVREAGTIFFVTPRIVERLSLDRPGLAAGFLRSINRALIARILDATDRFDETQARYTALSIPPVPVDAVGGDSMLRPAAEPPGKFKAAFLHAYRALLGAKASEKA